MTDCRLVPNLLYGIWVEVEEPNKLLRQLVDLLSRPPIGTAPPTTYRPAISPRDGGGASEPIPCCVNATRISDDCCLSHSCPHHDGWLRDANGEWYDPLDPNDPRYRPY